VPWDDPGRAQQFNVAKTAASCGPMVGMAELRVQLKTLSSVNACVRTTFWPMLRPRSKHWLRTIATMSRYPMAEDEQTEKTMEPSGIRTSRPRSIDTLTRRSAITALGAAMATFNFASSAASQSPTEPAKGAMTMGQYAMDKKTVSEALGDGGLLVVAQWEAKDGQADRVAEILHRFLPQAQSDPGAKLFLISRGKENPAQFLFYELFRDEAAFKAHQESAYFKTYIAGEALPLLSKRERAQYTLL
jgi:quinol monooxygenase YgiN